MGKDLVRTAHISKCIAPYSRSPPDPGNIAEGIQIYIFYLEVYWVWYRQVGNRDLQHLLPLVPAPVGGSGVIRWLRSRGVVGRLRGRGVVGRFRGGGVVGGRGSGYTVAIVGSTVAGSSATF